VTMRPSFVAWLLAGAALLRTESAAAVATGEQPPLECLDAAGRIQVAAKEIAHLETGDVVPRRVKSVSPRQPDPACKAPKIHLIVAEGVIDTKGAVCAVRLVKPDASCRTELYLEALRESEYTPALRGGRKIAVHFNWSMNIHYR
jgi:hypothetical protein